MSGGSKGGSQTSTTQNYSPEEAAQRAKVMSEAANVYGNVKDKISEAYPGPQVAGFAPESLAAQGYIRNYAANQAAAGVDQINKGVQYGLNTAPDVQNNPYFHSLVDATIRPITEAYTDPNGVLANIRQSSIGNGQYGGTRGDIAGGIAAGRYGQAIGDAVAKMGSSAYDTGQTTFARTLAFAPQALEAGQIPAKMLSAVGSQIQTQQQAENDSAAAARMYEINKEWLPLQNYANIVFGSQNPSTTSKTTQNGGSNGLFQTVGSLATLASLFI